MDEFSKQYPEKYKWCRRPLTKGGPIGLLLGNAVGFIVSLNSVKDQFESPINFEIIAIYSLIGVILGVGLGWYISNNRLNAVVKNYNHD